MTDIQKKKFKSITGNESVQELLKQYEELYSIYITAEFVKNNDMIRLLTENRLKLLLEAGCIKCISGCKDENLFNKKSIACPFRAIEKNVNQSKRVTA